MVHKISSSNPQGQKDMEPQIWCKFCDHEFQHLNSCHSQWLCLPPIALIHTYIHNLMCIKYILLIHILDSYHNNVWCISLFY